MSHHHHDGHHHHHHSNQSSESGGLSLEEKLEKLLAHWVSHNDDHARNYQDWGAQAREKGLNDVARLLEEAAELTQTISERFIAAENVLKSKPE